MSHSASFDMTAVVEPVETNAIGDCGFDKLSHQTFLIHCVKIGKI